jgi:hypothetical protein
MALKSSLEPLGSPADGVLDAVAPVSADPPGLSAPGAGRSLDGAAADARRPVARSAVEMRADTGRLAAGGSVLNGVTSTMQRTLTRLGHTRRFPVIG